jgi:uncharacterized protein (TIGR02145 family)
MNYKILVFPIFLLSVLFSCDDKTTNPKATNYESVTIGNQVWMKKNLDVNQYRNGDPIPEVKDSTQWTKLTTGAWCYYNNDSANGKIYGKLYNWYAVNDPRGLAPDGWHVASDEEWTLLLTYLGGENVAGGKLKEAGTTHWQSPNTGATNETGFSALPSGYHDKVRTFFDIGINGAWWSSTEGGTAEAWFRTLGCIDSYLLRDCFSKRCGFAIRCVKD